MRQLIALSCMLLLVGLGNVEGESDDNLSPSQADYDVPTSEELDAFRPSSTPSSDATEEPRSYVSTQGNLPRRKVCIVGQFYCVSHSLLCKFLHPLQNYYEQYPRWVERSTEVFVWNQFPGPDEVLAGYVFLYLQFRFLLHLCRHAKADERGHFQLKGTFQGPVTSLVMEVKHYCTGDHNATLVRKDLTRVYPKGCIYLEKGDLSSLHYAWEPAPQEWSEQWYYTFRRRNETRPFKNLHWKNSTVSEEHPRPRFDYHYFRPAKANGTETIQ
ncbi:hypothetical protein AAVH_32877 [Aphelenchoides avenae]|nr:hypothetical protein AAVH_32877 [Aphelenchus avenae]